MIPHMFNDYTIADMLLFSSETYVRLFELYNRDIWPLQIIALLFACGLLSLIWYRSAISQLFARLAYSALALCWFWVAYAFHFERYANINWAAKGFAALFTVEGLLLFATAGLVAQPLSSPNRNDISAKVGGMIILIGVVVWPVCSSVVSGSWQSIQLFALAPGPTAIGTLGFILLTKGRSKYLLGVIPLIWCVVSAATHWAMYTA